MRIGIDCRFWSQTGVGRYTRNLVLELQKIDKKNQYVLFVLPQDYDEVKSLITNPSSLIIKTNVEWHSLAEQIKFPSLLKKYNLDLVHFPYFSHPILYNRPFVVTIHDLIINHFPTGKASTQPMSLYVLKWLGYQRVLRHAVKKSKKIIVPLQFVKNDLSRTLGVSKDKIEVTPEGFDLAISKGKISKEIEDAAEAMKIAKNKPESKKWKFISSTLGLGALAYIANDLYQYIYKSDKLDKKDGYFKGYLNRAKRRIKKLFGY